MAKFTGVITIPYDLECSTPEVAEKVINDVLDTFGIHNFSYTKFTWDNPEWTINEVEEITNG